MNWVDPSTVAPGERATADQNWAIAQEVLTDLVDRLRAHRVYHCKDWICPGEAAALLASMDDAQIHMLARAAVERLAAVPLR